MMVLWEGVGLEFGVTRERLATSDPPVSTQPAAASLE